MNSRIGCTLTKLMDESKLCLSADTLEGSNAIQGDLERFEKWAHAKLLKFNRAKCKFLHLGWRNSKHNYRLGKE